MSYKSLTFEVADRIATITVNRPDKLNALNDATIGEMGHAIDEAVSRDDTGGILLTGAGRAFVAGADISELASQTPLEATERARRAVASTLGAWLPSLLLLSALTVGSLLAVGYALDPDDAVGALRRESEARIRAARGAVGGAAEPERDARKSLHPLLQAAPAGVRAPLAAILRARIAGLHQVPVSFVLASGAHADCLLVEQRDAPNDERFVALRETGSTVTPPAHVAAAPTGLDLVVAAALEVGSRPDMVGKNIIIIIPSFAERYLSTALFEGL